MSKHSPDQGRSFGNLLRWINLAESTSASFHFNFLHISNTKNKKNIAQLVEQLPCDHRRSWIIAMIPAWIGYKPLWSIVTLWPLHESSNDSCHFRLSLIRRSEWAVVRVAESIRKDHGVTLVFQFKRLESSVYCLRWENRMNKKCIDKRQCH